MNFKLNHHSAVSINIVVTVFAIIWSQRISSTTGEKIPNCCRNDTERIETVKCNILRKCRKLNCTNGNNFCGAEFPKKSVQFYQNGTEFYTEDSEQSKYCFNKIYEKDLETENFEVCLYRVRNVNIEELYFWTTLTSAIIVLFTISIFLLNWEGQNIHSWAQFSHCVSLFCLLICWTVNSYFNKTEVRRDEESVTCVGVAILTHYFYLSTFTWMAVINYDLLKMLSRVNKVSFKKHQRFPTFTSFSILGWGFPIVIVSGAIAMELFSRHIYTDLPSFLTPAYATEKCYLNDGVWLYAIFPLTILFMIILSQFTQTVKIFCQKKPNHQPSAYLLEKLNIKRNVLFVKIFILMGSIWILDIITSAITSFDDSTYHSWYIVLMDMIILLQAIPIFLIYSCRPQTLNQLERKYENLSPCIQVSRFLFCVSTTEPELLPVTKLRMHRRSTVAPLPEPDISYEY